MKIMRIAAVFSILTLLTGSLGLANSGAVEYARSGDNLRPKPFPAPASHPVTAARVAPGTMIHVRLEESVDTRRNRPGDVFTASVSSPVVENGLTVIPRGSRAYGRVVESRASGRFKGRGVVALRLEAIEIRGKRYAVQTSAISRTT